MSEEIETWKDVPGYEGLYAISSNGRIRVECTGVIKKQQSRDGRYMNINLIKDKVVPAEEKHTKDLYGN